jgi:hypothetical protein
MVFPRFGTSLILSFAILAHPVFPQDVAPKRLKIRIVEGDESVNNVRQRVAREPIVQVEDENRKPVAGAIVVFFLPVTGSGASFPGGVQSLTVVADESGRAVARGLVSNSAEGKYSIRVTASHRGTTGSADMKMSNSGPSIPSVSPTTVWIIVAAAAGAAVAGIVAASASGGSSSVSVGPPVVTPPR